MSQNKKGSEILEMIKNQWESEIVPRTKVHEFSMGLLNPKTCANRDANRSWRVAKMKFGPKVVYAKADLINYLEEKYSTNAT